MEEFHRMMTQFGWEPSKDPEFEAAREGIDVASVCQFNDLFGTDENDIDAWQTLCDVLDIKDVPLTLQGCKQVSRCVCVCVCVDLINICQDRRVVAC